MPITNNTYNITWRRLVTWLLPTPLRQTRLMAWMMALISPFVTLHGQLLRFRTSILYRLGINSQVCYLEKALNDKWDNQQRRIYITDPPRKPPRFIYRKAENKPVFVYRKTENKPVFLYTKAERNGIGVDFIIKVPIAVPFSTPEMIAFVNIFKLASKRFKIQVV